MKEELLKLIDVLNQAVDEAHVDAELNREHRRMDQYNYEVGFIDGALTAVLYLERLLDPANSK